MNGDKYVLDTNTVLYILNGDDTLSDFLYEKELFISIITEMELLSYKKISAKEEEKIKEFISEMRIVNLNNQIKDIVVEIKKQSFLKLPDSIIAATSIWLNLPFITSDKQFKSIDKLNLVYYEKE